MKCLLVEPSATLRRAVRNTLRTIGIEEIVDAIDGPQAMAIADASFDLVITEWSVPGTSGIELIKRIRANPETTRSLVMMLTARNRKDDVLEALQAGANGYVLKPFTSDTLRLGIETLLARTDDTAQAA